MAATPAPSLPISARRAPADTIPARLDASMDALAQQLASNPHRARTALRMALISAVGAGLMAAMHIDDSLGMYVLWSLVSAPAAMLVPATGLELVAASAVTLAISIPLAGSLVEAPWLLVSFFAMTAAAWSYHFTDAQLTNGWRMIEVVFLTTLFIVVFDPKNFGWSVAYTFGGMCVAFGLIMLFDNVLWPDPADARLLRLLTDATHATRKRLAQAGRAYLGPDGASQLPAPSLVGALSVHLSLLARADLEDLSPRRHLLLLGGVSTIERRRLEVERLIAVAREAVPRGIRAWVRPELEAALGAIDASLDVEADHFARDFHQSDQPDTVTPVEAALATLNDRITELHPRFIANVRADELTNLSAFIIGMQRIARLFRHPPIVLRDVSRKPAAREVSSPRGDPAKVRYCVKLAIAMALAFVVAMTAHRADLKTIILTVMVTGLPTYGASLHKMMLRFAGAALGGALALGAIVVTSPNFETVVSYLIVCFVIFYIAAYIGLSAGGLGYVGKQAGVTFVLVFIALSPSDKIYEPLYRLWGIFLGIIVVALVFLVFAPEYAGESMVPRLEKMLEAILALAPGAPRRLSEREIESLQIDSAKTLSQLLEIADDARIEGRRSIVDPDAIIETVGTLRRITNRLASGAVTLKLIEIPSLTPGFDSARARFNAALTEHFRDCLDFVKRRAHSVDLPIPDWDEVAARALVETLEREVAADGFAAVSRLPLEARRKLLAEMENSRRVTVLAGELSEQLSRIAPGRRASASRYAKRIA